MSFNGTSVGLDVHALSVVAHAVDEESGRVERAAVRAQPFSAEGRDYGGCPWRLPRNPPLRAGRPKEHLAPARIQQTVSDEISAIVAHREVIERAKGMLMLLYHLDVDAAFEVLKWRSQELNIRLHRVAAKLIADCPLC